MDEFPYYEKGSVMWSAGGGGGGNFNRGCNGGNFIKGICISQIPHRYCIRQMCLGLPEKYIYY